MPLLYVIFVLSGVAGLIYESIWSRYLGLFVGHSAYAQIIVLVIFLGGMSLGALLTGRITGRLRDPLIGYAVIELVVGLIGFLFHDLFQVVGAAAYDTLFPALPAGAAVVAAKWLVAALMILPQSIMLGATFPLMSAGALRRAPGEPGRVLALLYFANSIGAAAGALIAGFWLIRWLGLPGTLFAAATINVAVALGAWLIARGEAEPADAPSPAPAPPVGSPAPLPGGLTRPALRRLLLIVSFGTAAASFIYEIAWIRMLSLVLGSATHSFEIMLSAFILGLALGALWVRRRVDRWRDPLRVLARVQVAMALLAVATLPVYVGSFYATESVLGILSRSEGGYVAFSFIRYGIALAVMLPATFCAGMTLPLITRTLLVAGDGERAIGDVYGLNTLGSIVGAGFAGIAGLPLLGLKGLQALGAAGDFGLGLLLYAKAGGPAPLAAESFSSLRHRPPAGEPGLLARIPRWTWGAAAAGAALVLFTPLDVLVLTSGVYRSGRILRSGSFETIFYEDGRTATVTARRNRARLHFSIATNGKPDASMRSLWLSRDTVTPGVYQLVEDEPTQLFLPLITLAHAPAARDAAVIGQGSGISSHVLLASPALERLETIEIEPAMIRGSRTAFYPANRRVFDDPRSRFIVDDAKSHFASAHRTYDIIMSEPSNPWVSGVSGLFTSEFYQRVRGYLKPGGVFGQWLHLYELSDDLVLTVLAALHANFPAYTIYLVSGGDILVVASADSSLRQPDWSVLDLPGVAEDLRPFVPATAITMDGMWLADRAVLEPLLASASRMNSDFFPHLDLGAERTRFLRTRAEGFAELNAGRLDVVAMLAGRRAGFDTATTTIVPAIPRLASRAIGARVRRAVHAEPDTVRGDEDADAATFEWGQLQAAMALGRPPTDWNLWAKHVLSLDSIVHGGTSGVSDGAFYATIERYLARAAAPAEVVEALAFQRAVSEWRWADVSELSNRVIETTVRTGRYVVPAIVLHDATVVARLRLGDVSGARRAHRVLREATGRPGPDITARLIASHLAAAPDSDVASR